MTLWLSNLLRRIRGLPRRASEAEWAALIEENERIIPRTTTAEDWPSVMEAVIASVGSRAALIAKPACLGVAVERPFEVALAAALNGELSWDLRARTGGGHGLTDFPALGPYDVSVADGRPDDTHAAILEFKKWGAPGINSAPPRKRHETLWDVLKVGCSVARERSDRGYLVTLAPRTAWKQPHEFAALFDGVEWDTLEVCARHPEAMAFFKAGWRLPMVPARVRSVPAGTEAAVDACDGSDWLLRAVAIEPRGPLVQLVLPGAPAAGIGPPPA
ncbi:hypothetical protein [Miltoncostaea oceani]|uniref:hypothetical protein n=1 Tax=Miltoncostaea oceani TaxID=2843216 RepID=UPI001C3C5774|nr:hypothetical protein [Miltoncostaea oceani]